MKIRNKTPSEYSTGSQKVCKKNASEYKLNPAKIGVMGFSAGGHLAATASAHFLINR
ncbi:MAG: alpha/beta hydrolase fold domain-containing protein [Cytophagaceae bacterium]|nr:alpha/beta hydrolase fold domain-containing protein [Cytophagaceae bacterium]